MKTNQKLSIVSLLALGVLAAGFSAKPASAQVFQGKFTLPYEVHWGLATLPAGDYSFKLDEGYPEGRIDVCRGPQAVAFVQPLGYGNSKSNRSVIVVEAGIVRKLSLPQIGMDLTFAAHKPAHRAPPQEKELAQIIPVTAVGAAGR
jgi:hypothetical protein